MNLFTVPVGMRIQILTANVAIDGKDVGAATYKATATSDFRKLDDDVLRRRFTDVEPPLTGKSNDIWLSENNDDSEAIKSVKRSLEGLYSEPLNPPRQAAGIIGKPEINARRFLGAKGSKALLGKDHTPDTIEENYERPN